MDELKKRALAKHMAAISTPLPSGQARDLYSIMQLHQEAASILYDLAFSAGYRHRDGDKILETVKEENK